ncbi:hypothetical protein EEB11_11135, partial [Pseudotabrizicola sediminis]
TPSGILCQVRNTSAAAAKIAFIIASIKMPQWTLRRAHRFVKMIPVPDCQNRSTFRILLDDQPA